MRQDSNINPNEAMYADKHLSLDFASQSVTLDGRTVQQFAFQQSAHSARFADMVRTIDAQLGHGSFFSNGYDLVIEWDAAAGRARLSLQQARGDNQLSGVLLIWISGRHPCQVKHEAEEECSDNVWSNDKRSPKRVRSGT